MRKEGIGSYFHLEEVNTNWHSTPWLPTAYKLYYTGRHALLDILNNISKQQALHKIWVPNYYCQHTLGWIKQFYTNLYTYQAQPFQFNDIIDVSSFAGKNDAVLLNNYWGLSNMQVNTDADSPIHIEDHSHGWLSKSCMNSVADYCFSSLRKSLPIPLGGISWSPKGLMDDTSDNFKADASFYAIWDTMEQGMRLKKQFMDTDSGLETADYLSCFYEVEEGLNQNATLVCIKEAHKTAMIRFLTIDSLKYKQTNLAIIYDALKDSSQYKIIKKEGDTAFGLGLLFKDQLLFQGFRSHLIANGIYPSILWPDNNWDDEWRHFLNIHIDYRYQHREMEYIVDVIRKRL